ncbi:MAG TPA: hypothetical protein V6C52_08360 [Coleofasciculaceae cyanobacterium]|jgi:hypothetical protein
MPENKPETRPQETAPEASRQGQPAGKRKPDSPSPEEVRQFLAQANKSPDDFE